MELSPNYWREEMVFHTSDLTQCPRLVYHRHRGEVSGEVQTALFTGLLAHEVMERIHNDGWGDDVVQIVKASKEAVDTKIKKENRYYADALKKPDNIAEILKEVHEIATHYIERQKEYFDRCTVFGTELPVNWIMKVDGLPDIEFSSHIDLLYRDPNGEVRIRDYKYTEDALMMDHLARNLQFVLYHFCITRGQVKIGDQWLEVGEYPWLEVVDLRNFKPYKRAGESKDMNGGTIAFKKGDTRAIHNIVKEWRVDPEAEDMALRDIHDHIAPMRAGIFHKHVDRKGCVFCSANQHCAKYTTRRNP